MIYQAMHLKAKLNQTQKLSPAAIQNLKVLQLNQLELNAYLNSELESNPILEKDECSNLSAEELVSYFKSTSFNTGTAINKDSESVDIPLIYRKTLSEHLQSQLHLIQISDKTHIAADIIIGLLDEKGYLNYSLKKISSDFGISIEDLESGLKKIHSLDPAGVGARSISECLCLQIEEDDPDCDMLKSLACNFLEHIASNKLKQVSKELGLPLSKINSLLEKLRSLNPKPGLIYDSSTYSEVEYIIPDIYIEIDNNELKVKILDSLYPKLIINKGYRDLLSQDCDSESKNFISEKLNRAILLLKSLEQRKRTLTLISECIAKVQSDFFFQKSEILPLNMSDVAECVGVHKSTVSRAIKGKYVSSPAGMHSLKYFFSNNCVSSSEASSMKIKQMLKEIVASENPTKPYSDQKLCDILAKSELKVARRTVAKYRDELGIKSSSLRKEQI